MSDQPYAARVTAAVSRTRTASGMALRRRDGLAVFGAVTALYLVVYLWAIGHLAPGLGGYGVTVVADPLGRFLEPGLSPLSFRPVALVQIGPLTYLFSFNTVIGLGLAVLVGLNLALTYLAWRQPAACGLGTSSTGLLASVPALLSGTACCGPVLFIALGVQVSGVALTAIQWLLPVAALALVGSLVLVGRRIRPTAP
mgnify:CR=1 FL=1